MLMVSGGGGQIGGADKGDGGNASSYREVAEAGTRKGVEGLAKVDIGLLDGGGGELIWIYIGGGEYLGGGGLRTAGILRSCIEKHTATNCISIRHRGKALLVQ